MCELCCHVVVEPYQRARGCEKYFYFHEQKQQLEDWHLFGCFLRLEIQRALWTAPYWKFAGESDIVERSSVNVIRQREGLHTTLVALQVYVSNWRFSDQFHFLNDSFTPRQTKSNANRQVDSPYNVDNPPSFKTMKKVSRTNDIEIQNMMKSATSALEQIASNENKAKSKGNIGTEDEDEIFCNLLKTQLSQIRNCDEKDDLKIALQQMVLACKRKLKNVNPIPLFPTNTFANHSYDRFNSP